MKETRVPLQTCFSCGYKTDACSDMGDDATPQDGSISLCLACGALSIFQEDLTLRKPTSEEIGEIMADDEMRLMLAKMERARLLTMRDKVVMDGRIRNMPAPPDL